MRVKSNLLLAGFVLPGLALSLQYAWGHNAPKLLRQFDFRYAGALPSVPLRPEQPGVELEGQGEWQGDIEDDKMPNMTSPAGHLILVAAQKRFTLFDYLQGREIRSYDVPQEIAGAALSADGKQALVGQFTEHPRVMDTTCECSLALYDLGSGARVRTLRAQDLNETEALNLQCRFTPDGQHVFTYLDGRQFLWEIATGNLVKSDMAIPGFGSGPDARGRYFYYQRCWIEDDGSPLASLYSLPERKRVASWNALDRPLPLPLDRVLAIDIPPSGSHVVYGVGITTARGTDPRVHHEDGYVGSFNTRTGATQFRTDRLRNPSHYGSVPAVAVATDGQRIVACTKIGMVLLDGKTGDELLRWRPEPRVKMDTLPPRANYLTPYIATAFSSTEKEVIVCDFWGRVTVWALASEVTQK